MKVWLQHQYLWPDSTGDAILLGLLGLGLLFCIGMLAALLWCAIYWTVDYAYVPWVRDEGRFERLEVQPESSHFNPATKTTVIDPAATHVLVDIRGEWVWFDAGDRLGKLTWQHGEVLPLWVRRGRISGELEAELR